MKQLPEAAIREFSMSSGVAEIAVVLSLVTLLRRRVMDVGVIDADIAAETLRRSRFRA